MTSSQSNNSTNTVPYNFSENLGENPRINPGIQAVYRSLRDARSKARAAERAQEIPGEDGHIIMAAPAEWGEVHDLSREILSDHALDVEVAVWLIEATARTRGYTGLSAAVNAVSEMVKMWGNDLHPQPEDVEDDTFESLGGLNGLGREGTLIQPLRLLPLVPDFEYGSHTIWDVETAGKTEAVQAAMSTAGDTAMLAYLGNVVATCTAFAGLNAVLTELRGADAPPFARIIDLLDDTARTIRRLSGLSDVPTAADDPATDDVTESGNPAATGAGTPTAGRIETREDALRTLSDVARFFRRTEPHSPMSHTIETLVRRGRMDFMTLLTELIPDENARVSFLTTAGIKDTPDAPDSAE
ncbi:ImpA family type VI secretion system protein [Yoonia maritima]|uniref:type VI secretion system protein TssA n=1 Tax=Yoonia maritima TaxID=1435347 RepID=UPI000D0EFE64|nr:type VI secretion system ImpA family N-terminal domain-containing protein [Yoonia maritima]